MALVALATMAVWVPHVSAQPTLADFEACILAFAHAHCATCAPPGGFDRADQLGDAGLRVFKSLPREPPAPDIFDDRINVSGAKLLTAEQARQTALAYLLGSADSLDADQARLNRAGLNILQTRLEQRTLEPASLPIVGRDFAQRSVWVIEFEFECSNDDVALPIPNTQLRSKLRLILDPIDGALVQGQVVRPGEEFKVPQGYAGERLRVFLWSQDRELWHGLVPTVPTVSLVVALKAAANQFGMKTLGGESVVIYLMDASRNLGRLAIEHEKLGYKLTGDQYRGPIWWIGITNAPVFGMPPPGMTPEQAATAVEFQIHRVSAVTGKSYGMSAGSMPLIEKPPAAPQPADK